MWDQFEVKTISNVMHMKAIFVVMYCIVRVDLLVVTIVRGLFQTLPKGCLSYRNVHFLLKAGFPNSRP